MVLTLNKRKESRMDAKTMKELEEAHKKAMEGINDFIKWMHDITEACNDYLGIEKDN